MTDKDLFSPDPEGDPEGGSGDNQEPEKYFDSLVGEGKKYADAEALAKGNWHSAKHIKTLEAELAEARKYTHQLESLEEVARKFENFQIPSNQPNNPAGDPDDGDVKSTLSPDKVQELVQETYRQQKEADTQAANVESCKTKLREVWGSNYQKRIQERAESLGLGREFANGLAATHPKAFLRLMLDQPGGADGGSDFTPPTPSVTTKPAGSGKMKYRDYEKIRKEDPRRYYQLQMQMDRDALEQGEDFYK